MPSGSPALGVTSQVPSPFLSKLITEWTGTRKLSASDISEQIDDLLIQVRQLDDQWKTKADSHRKALQELEQSQKGSDERWLERLRRIEGWLVQIRALEERYGFVAATVAGIRWFERARTLAERLTLQFVRRAALLEEGEARHHGDLQQWVERLSVKEAELKVFKEKADSYPGPFLVSRARKQPEALFVNENARYDAEVSLLHQSLRKTVSLYLGRLYRSAKQVEERSKVNPALFEGPRKQIMENLKPTQDQSFALREKVLADALLYESCRRKLRWIKQTVSSIRCIEEVYKAPEPFWKRVLRAF